MARTGVFVCHCGTNIAKTVVCEQVAQAARAMPGVVYATDYRYICSAPGQQLIQEAIRDQNLDSVVVASCSPRLHEPTFRRCVEEAGLNPYLMEMANIREQCSWVHDDQALATAKAIALVRAAVAKVQRNEPLFSEQLPLTKRALVLGGGIAGIQAALDIADAGYEVLLVERSPSIGGHMAQFDKTFPTLDCAACILTPKMVDAASHPNIRLLTWSELESVQGYVGNFEVTIRQKARYVDAELCIGCAECWVRCPVKNVPAEFDEGLGPRTAIYVPFPQAVPLVPVIDKEHCRYLTEGKCGVCAKRCPKDCIRYDDEDKLSTEQVGALVVATGFDVEKGALYGEYGYGQYENVITGLEFERLVNLSGPTEGKVLRPSDQQPPQTVVFVQCAGSRDPAKGVPYCSRVCCMYTAKQVLLLKEKHPETDVYVFYLDIRAGGKNYEEFVQRVQDEFGAKYIRGRPSAIFPSGDKLVVRGADTMLGLPVEVEADLVVLASPILAREDAKDVARKLGLDTDQHSFFTEAHPKLRPAETLTAGVYLAGGCQFAKDIPDAVASAGAAAAKVVGLFAKDSLESEPMIAEVDEASCVGCLNCLEVCPFTAIEEKQIEDPRTKQVRTVASVNAAICEGCGTCAAACPSKCITVKGFKDSQLLAAIDILAV